MTSSARRVVYIVVDGMCTDAFEQVIASGRAPALSFIKDHGSYVRDCVAVFPTITPAATASLITGATPVQHRIPGMCWYDRDAGRFVNYGQSPRAAVVQGMKRMVRDFLVNMNTKHLSPDVRTLHESLGELGLTTASINFLIFRGPHLLEVEPTLLQRLFLRKHLPAALPGPKEHYFADLVNGASNACDATLKVRGFDKKMAATDAYAACVTRDLLRQDAADMILFYLHENDHLSHRRGPSAQVDSLARADEHVAHVLDTFGSWEQTIEEVGFVITADHAQSPISDDKGHILDLHEILGDFSHAIPDGKDEGLDDKDIASCGNGRAAFFYLNQARRSTLLDEVVTTLSACEGIDQVMWRDGDLYYVDSERGRLRFFESDDGVSDDLGNRWAIDGALEAVSGTVGDGTLSTPEYPLALWRIKNALGLDRIGDVVATTKLTWECTDLGGADHRGGGDHASLHAQDSLVPFVSTLDSVPNRPTTIDAAPHIYEHFLKVRAGT